MVNRLSPRVRRRMRFAGLGLLALVLAVALGALAYIGPKDLFGMLRYDQRREGDLIVGALAPDVVLTALDGATGVHLREWVRGRPLVLVFGSFT